MQPLKLRLNASQWQALAALGDRLNFRYPLEQLRQDATGYTLITLVVEVGLQATVKAKRMKFSGQESARLTLTQAEALAFYALWECGEFDDWPRTTYEFNFIASLCRQVHQHYALNPQATHHEQPHPPEAISDKAEQREGPERRDTRLLQEAVQHR